MKLAVLALLAAAVATASALAPVSLSVDLDDSTTPFPQNWRRCFGSGHTLLGTRVDWRDHLQRARNEIGLQGIRMHGILDDDMSAAPTKDPASFSFYNVDIVYDYMVSLGLRPIVELSFMPASMANCTQDCPYAFDDPGSYKGIVAPPADYNDWYNLVHALVQHFVDRYTLGEVSQWHFEVWNEMWAVDYPSDYLRLYNASAVAVKNVHPSLKIGGPATMQVLLVQDFIEDTKRAGIPVDFVSTHFYPSDPACSVEAPGMNDPECFQDTIKGAQSIATAAGLPFFLTEYNDGLMDGHHRDTSYASSFLLHNIPNLTSFDILSWWTFSDVFEEGWMNSIPFYNGYGLLTKQGVPKPAYRAFQILFGAGPERVPVKVSDPVSADSATSLVTAFATVAENALSGSMKDLQVFVTNFSPMAGATAKPVPVVERNVTLTIKGGSTNPTLRLGRIDDEATNPFQQWVEWGSPQYLTTEQISTLQMTSQMNYEIIQMQGNTVTFSIPPYGSVHIAFDS